MVEVSPASHSCQEYSGSGHFWSTMCIIVWSCGMFISVHIRLIRAEIIFKLAIISGIPHDYCSHKYIRLTEVKK